MRSKTLPISEGNIDGEYEVIQKEFEITPRLLDRSLGNDGAAHETVPLGA